MIFLCCCFIFCPLCEQIIELACHDATFSFENNFVLIARLLLPACLTQYHLAPRLSACQEPINLQEGWEREQGSLLQGNREDSDPRKIHLHWSPDLTAFWPSVLNNVGKICWMGCCYLQLYNPTFNYKMLHGTIDDFLLRLWSWDLWESWSSLYNFPVSSGTYEHAQLLSALDVKPRILALILWYHPFIVSSPLSPNAKNSL